MGEDQTVGGGRTKCGAAAWKIRSDETSTLAIGAAAITGVEDVWAAFSLAWGAEQIEQVCRGEFGPAGCEWTACAVPIATMTTMQSIETALLHQS